VLDLQILRLAGQSQLLGLRDLHYLQRLRWDLSPDFRELPGIQEVDPVERVLPPGLRRQLILQRVDLVEEGEMLGHRVLRDLRRARLLEER
jgi:hypothetical protein